jgi:glycosyltransferase involved in cell wall biosynthesis
MNLLVVSHACVTSINQAFFAAVERISGWRITLITPSSWKSEYGVRAVSQWPEFKGELRPVPVWGSGNVPLHVYRTLFVSLLREVDPAAIYVHHEPYGLATAQVYLANRLSIDRPIGFFTWQNISKRFPVPFRNLEQMVFQQSRFAISGSESACVVLEEKGYGGPAAIIPAGIDPEQFTDSDETDRPPDLPGASCLIGFVGRITEEKGLQTLVEALSRVKELPWHLVLIGTGDLAERLKNQARRLGLYERLTFLGYVPHEDVPSYLAHLDLVVLPSETQPNWKEQFGRILIEAMACGTPVLGSDSGEIPNVIRTTGGGRVFAEQDVADCAAQLRVLVQRPALRDELSETGQSHVYANFTHAALARKFIGTVEATCL